MGTRIKNVLVGKMAVLEYIFFSTIIVFIGVRNISVQTSPAILLDEFGYWASGASMAGLDWSGITSQLCPYYSYGVGIILSLIIALVGKPEMWYRTAIIINIILVCAQFYVLSLLFIKIFPSKKKELIILLSFCVQFLSSILVYSQFVWAEIPLSFLYIVSTYILYNLCISGKIRYYIAFAVSLVFMYIVHQRALGVVLVGLGIIILNYFFRRNRKGTILFTVIFLLLLMVSAIVKNKINENLWNNTSQNIGVSVIQSVKDANTYNGVWERIRGIFSPEGIKSVIIGIAGKIYYSACSTFLLFFEGIYYAVSTVRMAIVKKDKRYSTKFLLYIYFVGSYFSMVCIASVYFIYYGRIDQIMYGRYTDWVILPIIILGITSVREEKINALLKRFSIYAAIVLSIALFLFNIIQEKKISSYFGSCAPFGYIFQKDAPNLEWIFYMTLFIVLIGMILIISLNKTNLASTFVCLVIVIYLMRSSDSVIEKEFDNADRKIVHEIAEVLEEAGEVYYLYGDNIKQNQLIGSIQFSISKTIHCIGDGALETIDNGVIIKKTEEGCNSKAVIYQNDIFQIIAMDTE